MAGSASHRLQKMSIVKFTLAKCASKTTAEQTNPFRKTSQKKIGQLINLSKEKGSENGARTIQTRPPRELLLFFPKKKTPGKKFRNKRSLCCYIEGKHVDKNLDWGRIGTPVKLENRIRNWVI